jgi:hypothetical protein
MLAERRTRALRDLGSSLAGASDEMDIARRSVDILAQFEFDLPFLLYYALDPDSDHYRLAARFGIVPGAEPTPINIAPSALAPWPLARALETSAIIEVDDLPSLLRGEASGPYEEAPRRAFVIPIVVPTAERTPAVLITGVSPRLRLTADYRSFYDLVGINIARAFAVVRAREDERRRAEALAEIDRGRSWVGKSLGLIRAPRRLECLDHEPTGLPLPGTAQPVDI